MLLQPITLLFSTGTLQPSVYTLRIEKKLKTVDLTMRQKPICYWSFLSNMVISSL